MTLRVRVSPNGQQEVKLLAQHTRGPRGGGSLLPPSSCPTHVGTTASIAFRAVIGADGEVDLRVALQQH